MLAALGRVKQLSPAEGGPKERLQARAISDRASQQLGCLVGQYTNHTNTEGRAVWPGTQPHSQGDQVTQEPGLLASTSGPRPPPATKGSAFAFGIDYHLLYGRISVWGRQR